MTDDTRQPTDPDRDDAERIEPDTIPGPIEDGDSVSEPEGDEAETND